MPQPQSGRVVVADEKSIDAVRSGAVAAGRTPPVLELQASVYIRRRRSAGSARATGRPLRPARIGAQGREWDQDSRCATRRN